MYGSTVKIRASNYDLKKDLRNFQYNFRRYITAGHAVAQWVDALRYKPEGRGFDSRWCHWIFFH